MTSALRTLTVLCALCSAVATATADVWMVRTVDVPACRDNDALARLDSETASGALSPKALPAGCISLYSGERLIEQTQLGQGFVKYMKVERGDGSMLFVRSSDVVSDPGIGSVSEDR